MAKDDATPSGGAMRRRTTRATSNRFVGRVPRGRSVLGEVIGLAVTLLLFTYLHAAAGRDVTRATANAVAVQSIERFVHMNVERTANGWLAGHRTVIPAAVYYYRLYYAVLVAVLLWVFVAHADVYPKVRRTFVAMTALVLPVFWALPVSPPRFALSGIVDIVADHDILGSHTSRGSGAGQNHYSAMPSLHVGWSAWCAYAVWSALRSSHPRSALLAWMLPLMTAADVLTTGNHYVLDIVGSAVLLVASIGLAAAWGRLVERRRAEHARSTSPVTSEGRVPTS